MPHITPPPALKDGPKEPLRRAWHSRSVHFQPVANLNAR